MAFGGVGGGGFGGPHMMPAGGFWLQTWLDKKGFSEAHREMAALGTEMKIIGRDFMIAGGLMAVPFFKAAQAAQHATTVNRAFNAVFKEGSTSANRFVDDLSKRTGRFNIELRESLMSIQALFKGMRMENPDELARFTQSLMTDLAAFRGLSDQDIMARFVSTLSGSVEAMDQLGIDVHEHAIQQELLAMNINKSVQEASEQEKIMARLNVIFRSMSAQGAIGAAERAMSEFDGQVVQLTTSFKELQHEIGRALIPMLNKLLPIATSISGVFGDIASAEPRIVQSLGAIAAATLAAGSAMWIFGAATRAWIFAAAGIGLGGWAMLFRTIGGGLALAGIQSFFEALSGGAEEAAERIENLRSAHEELIDSMSDADRDKINALYEDLKEIEGLMQQNVDQGLFTELLGGDTAGAVERLSKKWAEIQSQIREMLDSQRSGLGDGLEEQIAESVKSGLTKGMLEGTFSILSERMFANQLGEMIEGVVPESLTGSEARARNAQERSMRRDAARAQQDSARAEAGSDQIPRILRLGETRDALASQLQNPNLTPEGRQRVAVRLQRVEEQYRQESNRLAALNQSQESQEQERRDRIAAARRRYASGERVTQYGTGESIFGPAPGQGRYRHQDPGAYIVDEEGNELFYGERGAGTPVPGDLTQGGEFGLPYEGPYSGDASSGGSGPFFHYEGTPQGATAFPVAPTPEDMPAMGGFGGAARPPDPYAGEPRYRSDTELINAANKQIHALEEVRDAILNFMNELANLTPRYES